MLSINESTQLSRTWRAQSGLPSTSRSLDWLGSAWVQHLTAALFVTIIGYFAQHLSIGLILLGVYALVALLFKIPSDVSFKVALLGLVALAVLTALGLEDLLNIYAQYVFLLLCIGTAGALAEQWRGRDRFLSGQSAKGKVVAGRRDL